MSYHPSDFEHGLLAHHCDYYTGELYKKNDVLCRKMLASLLGDNYPLDVLDKWRVLDCIYDAKTEYLGVIYVNSEAKQLVLAHRATMFASFLKRIGQVSTVSTDIQGVVLNETTSYQENGYDATRRVVTLLPSAEYSEYALSFTGFSLGAWMAELSVYYCHQDKEINYPNTKAVTFDGPGSLFMIEDNLKQSSLYQRSRSDVHICDLDIVSYLSSPNIVNCTNRHIGQVYALYDRNETPSAPNVAAAAATTTSGFASFFSRNKPSFKSPLTMLEEFLGIDGHDMTKIIQRFDPATGKPHKIIKVLDWPLIRSLIPPSQQQQQQQEHQHSTKTDTTLFSYVRLLANLKEIALDEFLSYKTSGPPKSDFQLKYCSDCKLEPLDVDSGALDSRTCTDLIDAYVKELLARQLAELAEPEHIRHDVHFIFDHCWHDRVENALKSRQRGIFVSDIRDRARRLFAVRRSVQTIAFRTLDSISFRDDFLLEDVADAHLSVSETLPFERIDRVLDDSNVVCITGVSGSGKSTLASQYARHYVALNRRKYNVVCVKSFRQMSSVERFKCCYVNFFVDKLMLSPSMTRRSDGDDDDDDAHFADIVRQISERFKRLTSRNDRYLFIFDDLYDAALVDGRANESLSILQFMQMVASNFPEQVKLIITTRLEHRLFDRNEMSSSVLKLELIERHKAQAILEQKLKKVAAATDVSRFWLLLENKEYFYPLDLTYIGSLVLHKSITQSPVDQIAAAASNEVAEEQLAYALFESIATATSSAADTVLKRLMFMDKHAFSKAYLRTISKLDESVLNDGLAHLVYIQLLVTTSSSSSELFSMHESTRKYLKRYAKRSLPPAELTRLAKELLHNVHQELMAKSIVLLSDLRHSFRLLETINDKLGFDERLGSSMIEVMEALYRAYNVPDEVFTICFRVLEVYGNKEDLSNIFVRKSVKRICETLIECQANDAGQFVLTALEAFRSAGNEAEDIVDVLLCAGEAHYQAGEYDRSLACYEESLKMRKTIEDGQLKEARTWVLTAITYLAMGNYEKAIEHSEKACSVYTNSEESFSTSFERKEQLHQAEAFSVAALAYARMCRYTEALSFSQKSLDIFTRASNDVDADQLLRAEMLYFEGFVYYELKEYDKALGPFEQSLTIKNKKNEFLRHSEDMVNTLIYIGCVHFHLKEFKQACESMDKAIEAYLILNCDHHNIDIRRLMRQHEAHSIDFNMHDKLRSAMRPEMQVTITKNADDKSEPVSKLKCFNHSFQLLV